MTTPLTPIHRLLCFAHRGEAKSFFHEYNFKAIGENFYECDDHLSLIIMGEGTNSTLINLTRALVFLSQKYSKLEVINLGVCGALSDSPFKFEINQVVEIGTCYAQDEFKSFTCEKGDTSIISTKERVLNQDQSKSLSHFAPLVDREAWAVGLVCQELKVPFQVIKVVSDFADGDICARVKEDTEIWSDSLLRALKTLNNSEGVSENSDTFSFKEKLPELHITLSQERKLKQLLKALSLKGHDLDSVLSHSNYRKLVTQDIRPKEKTKELTLRLQELLNPLEKTLREKLSQNTEVLKKAGFQVSFDQGYEQERVHLHTTLESEAQINKLITALESYDFMELRNILRGKDDV